MRWLAERGGPIERFNQAMLLQVPAGLREDHLIARPAGAARSSRRAAAAACRCRAGRRAGRWRSRRPARSRRAACLRRVDVAGLDEAALRACIERAGAGGRAAACAGGGRDGAGGLVRCRRSSGRPAAADHPSSGGRRGVVAHPGARPGGGLGGDCGAGEQPALPARGTSFRRWAQRLAAHAQEPSAARGACRSGRGMLSAPSLSLVDGALDPRRDITGTRRAAHADAAGRGHRGAADAGCRRRSMAASTMCC